MSKIEAALLQRVQDLLDADSGFISHKQAFVINELSDNPEFVGLMRELRASVHDPLTAIYSEENENTPIYDAAYAAEALFYRKVFTTLAAMH